MVLAVVAALVAVGAAMFWAVRGGKGLITTLRSWRDLDQTAAAYLASKGHDLGTAKTLSLLPQAAELLVALVLLAGAVMLVMRTLLGVVLVAVGGGLGVGPPVLFAVASMYWSAPPLPPVGSLAATVLGLIALVLVLLRPVTSAVRRAPARTPARPMPPPYGRPPPPYGPQQPPPLYGPQQAPPPYGPQQAPPPYGPPRPPPPYGPHQPPPPERQ